MQVIKYTHVRPIYGDPDGPLCTKHELNVRGLQPDPRGGATQVKLAVGEGAFIVGQSYCSSKDNFSRKIGREVAAKRVMEACVAATRALIEITGEADTIAPVGREALENQPIKPSELEVGDVFMHSGGGKYTVRKIKPTDYTDRKILTLWSHGRDEELPPASWNSSVGRYWTLVKAAS